MGEAQFPRQGNFLGTLTKFDLPVLATTGILVCKCGGVISQPGGLGVGFLGRIDMLVPIPEPLVRPLGDAPQ